jgi:peptidoglycan biosynthesis protein MviN/MurJ (putative lipid II flippase)
MKADWIGWLATVLFAVSYFCRKPATLRRVQGVGALTWMAYGALIHSLPVVVANIIVASVALWSSFARPRRAENTPESTLQPAPRE